MATSQRSGDAASAEVMSGQRVTDTERPEDVTGHPQAILPLHSTRHSGAARGLKLRPTLGSLLSGGWLGIRLAHCLGAAKTLCVNPLLFWRFLSFVRQQKKKAKQESARGRAKS